MRVGSRIGAGVRARLSQLAPNRCGQRHTTTPRAWLRLGARVFVLALALSRPALAQDGGVWVYRRAALELPTGEIVMVDAGVAMDGPVAIERARELQRAREDRTPQWLTVALSVVATGVWVADRVRAWTSVPAP